MVVFPLTTFGVPEPSLIGSTHVWHFRGVCLLDRLSESGVSDFVCTLSGFKLIVRTLITDVIRLATLTDVVGLRRAVLDLLHLGAFVNELCVCVARLASFGGTSRHTDSAKEEEMRRARSK